MVGNRKLLLVIATLASSACSFLTGLAASFAMLSKEARLVTSAFFTRQDCEDALDALSAGAAEPRLLVTDTIGLDATPATFEAHKRRTHQCKVLIAP